MENINTDRLILRRPKSSDKEQLFVILHDEEVKKYLPRLYFQTLDEFSYFFDVTLDYLNKFSFVIEDKSSKKLIGLIHSYISPKCIASVSYVIKAEERGKDYMSEALKAFISYLYKKQIAYSINFNINKDNISSMRIMEKLKIPLNLYLDKYLSFNLSLQKKPSF